MAAIAEAVAGLAEGLFQGGINVWRARKEDEWNQINFDYQKALQQQIFEREDNAVQRRMADLKAAGLNPNLAAGSAANAGSVVGRANTSVKDINIGNPVGNALDYASHVAQLRAQREQNQILKNESKKSAAEAKMAENENLLNSAELFNLLGIKADLKFNKKTNELELSPVFNFPDWSVYTEMSKDGGHGFEKSLDAANSRLMQYLNWQYQNGQNSAALLQKDVDWYTADKIANYAGTAASIFSGFGSGYRNFNYTNKRR